MALPALSQFVHKSRRDVLLLIVAGGMVCWLGGVGPSQAKPAATAPAARQVEPAPKENGEKPAASVSAGAAAAASLPATASAPASMPAIGERTGEISLEAILSARQSAEKSNLDSAVKAQALELYDKAAADIKKAADERTLAMNWRTQQSELGAKAKALRDALAKEPAESSTTLPASAPADELDRIASQAQAAQSAAGSELNAAKKEIEDRTARRAEIPRLMLANRERRDALTAQFTQPPPSDEPTELSVARKTALQAEATLQGRQNMAMMAENRYYDATSESNVLILRQDLATRRQQLAQRANQQIQEQLTIRRKAEAERAAEQARKTAGEAADMHPLVRRLAEENQELAQLRTGPSGLAASIERTQKQSTDLLAQLPALRNDFKSIQDRVKAVGLTNTIGQLLRRQRATLPNLAELRRESRARRSAIGEAQLQWIDLRARRSKLDDLDARVKELMAAEVGAAPELAADARERLKTNVRDLLEAQRTYLDALIADYDSYSTKLILVDTLSQQLMTAAQNFQRYIDERVLWTRSGGPIYQIHPRDILPSLAWLADPKAWRAIGGDCVESLRSHPLSIGLVMLILLGGLLGRRKLRRKLESLSQDSQHNEPTMRQTAFAAMVTLLMVGITPAAICFLAGLIAQSEGATELADAVAAGLLVVALAHLAFGMLIQTLAPKGLAEAHLHWPAPSAHRLRRRLKVAMAVALPPMFLVACYQSQDDDARKIVGRLAFIVFMVLLGLFWLRVLKPSGSAMRPALERIRGSWHYKLRHGWYVLAVLMPLGLAGLAGAGFYYTAIEFGWRMLASVWLAMGVTILGAILQQWAAAARRAIALPQAMSRLEARHARKEEGEISDAVSAVAAKPEVGLAQMRKQSRRLLQWAMAALFVGGLWLIWSGVVPALGGVLNEPLWTYTADNNPLKILQVTYQDLMAAAVVLLLTLAASKNIPGLMQIVLLKRLEMASSGVYVVTALTRYVVLIVGFVVAFGLLGISWGKIQVLVAAVTLGLSFGLQEIFANFISGLILLLERPIRIGDVVTVGDVTGVVSRIRTRATTITDFNHKELIVPNKAFITGQLVNWTLSDTILRLAIPVSILHGSDVDLAQRLLMEAANKSSLVLKEPPPIVRLLTLETKVTLELKVCVSNMDNYRKAGHELLVAIERSFRENRIPLM